MKRNKTAQCFTALLFSLCNTARIAIMLTLIGLSAKAQDVEVKKIGNSESATIKMDFQLGKFESSKKTNVSLSENGMAINKKDVGAKFVSKKIKVPIKKVDPFLTLAAVWEAEDYFLEDVTIQYRVSYGGKKWRNWEEFKKDEHNDSKDDFSSPGKHVSSLIYLDKKAKYIQCRIIFKKESSAIIRTLRLDLFSPGILDENGNGQKKSSIESIQEQQSLVCPCPSLSYTTRSSWGCPDGQNSPLWTPQTTTVTHLVVHHAAGYGSSPYAQQVLAVWNLHTNTNGWGDIGYNWVIDPNGVLYQGRAWSGSSDNTIGAHMCACNAGKMGVCLLGDYTSSTPTAAAYNTLKQLLAWKSCSYNISATGSSATTIKNCCPNTNCSCSSSTINNIIGHRDGCASCTSCPGNAFYPQLSTLRTDVQSYINSCGGGGGSEDIIVANASVSPTSVACGSTVDVDADHTYSGSQLDDDLPSFDIDYYLSTNCTFDGSDVLLGGDLSGLGSDDPVNNETATLTIPTGISAGTYYILFVGDADNELTESNENNNVTCVSISVTCGPGGEDITVTSASVSPSTVPPSGDINVEADHVYSGNQLDDDLPSFDLDYYLSTDCAFDGSDVLLGGDLSGLGNDDPVNTETQTLTIPAGTTPGNYYILFVGDAENELAETNEGNNVACVQITVGNPTADITVTNTSVTPTSVGAGCSVEVLADHVYSGNQLDADLPSYSLDYYLSTNCDFDGSDILLGDDISALGSDNPVNTEDDNLTIPAGTSPGVYYILFVGDADNELGESNENNNIVCEQITIVIVEEDITVANTAVTPTAVDAGNTVDVQADHVYGGCQPDADLPSFDLDYYLSTDCSFSGGDVLLDGDASGIGGDDPVEVETATLTIPVGTLPGTYYILFVGDADSELSELDENNNVACYPIQVIDPNCIFTLNPANSTFDHNGGQGNFAVSLSTGNNCNYNATTGNSWIQISNGSGTNSGTVNYTLAPCIDQDSSRSGTITVGNTTFIITQSCTTIVGINEAFSSHSVNIFPNPNSGKFTLQIQTFAEQEIQVSVVNIIGQEIFKATPKKIAKEYSMPIELNKAAAGVYFLQVRFGNSFISKKIVISQILNQ